MEALENKRVINRDKVEEGKLSPEIMYSLERLEETNEIVDGVIIRIDELGRLLFPKKWRTQLGIMEGTYVEIVKQGHTLAIVPLKDDSCGSIGIVKKVDDLGRIVIPKKVRVELGITNTTELEVCRLKNIITVEVKQKACCLCGKKQRREEVVLNLHGKIICGKCKKQIVEL